MDEGIIKNIPIDLYVNARKRVEGTIDVKLGSKDIGTGVFEFSFINEKNQKIVLDDTYSSKVMLKFKDSDNTYIEDASILDGVVRFVFPHEFIYTSGLVTLYVYLTRLEKTSDVAAITFRVYRSEIDNVAKDVISFYDKNYEDILAEFKGRLDISKDELLGLRSNSNNAKPMKQMLLYYGNPIEINDAMTVEKAAKIYSKYDMIVFNGNIEEPTHRFHENTKLIVARVKELNPTIEIFGYIHSHDPVLRDTTSSQPFLPIPIVDEKCKKWRDLIGATGIFLDAFGYDYWVTRTRQNELLDTVHANGMNAITNSWMVDYVFSKENYSFNNGLIQSNPNNVQIKLGPDDYYLFENHIYRRSYYTDGVQEANDSDRVHQSAYYHFEPRDEYGGKSYYEHFGTKTISLNALQEPNIRFFTEAYLIALATGCEVFSMSGAGWTNKDYPHFEPPVLNAGPNDVDNSEYSYSKSQNELHVKASVGLHQVEIQYNQPNEIKNIYEFPNEPFVFKIDLSGALNVDTSIQIVLNALLYYPRGIAGDTAEVLATKIAAFDYGADWIVSVVNGTTVRFEFRDRLNPENSGRGSAGGNYMYLSTRKGIGYSYNIESLAFKVIRRITLDGKFLHSESGVSVLRPHLPNIGTQYFDQTLSIPIWFNGISWVDVTGTTI